MKVVRTKETNVEFRSGWGQVVPACMSATPEKDAVFVWRVSLLERFRLLFTGRIYSSFRTYGAELPPPIVTIDKFDVMATQKQIDRRIRKIVKRNPLPKLKAV